MLVNNLTEILTEPGTNKKMYVALHRCDVHTVGIRLPINITALSEVGKLIAIEMPIALWRRASATLFKASVRICRSCRFASLVERPSRLTPRGISKDLQLLGRDGFLHNVKQKVGSISKRIRDCPELFSAREVAISLSVLRGYDESSKELLNLLAVITPKVLACEGEMTPEDISKILNRMRILTSESAEVKDLLKALTLKVTSSTRHWSASDISKALCGLCSMDCSSSVVLSLLNEIHQKLRTCEDEFSSANIADSFHGLKNKKSKSNEVRQLALALGSRVKRSTGTFTNADLTNYFKGIAFFENHFLEKNIFFSLIISKVVSSECIDGPCLSAIMHSLKIRSNARPEVRSLLLALAKKIEKSEVVLQSREVAGVLFGMQNMDSNDSHLRAFLAALAPLIARCDATLSARDVGMSLYGLKGMDAVSSEVRAVLVALLPKIQTSRPIDNQAVGNALYGLQNMTPDYHEVAAVVSALAKLISSRDSVFASQNVGNALYGMQSMSSDFIEVRELVAALAPKVSSAQGILKPQELGNALYGLQRLSSDHVEVRNLLTSLVPKIMECSGLNSQEISNSLYGLRAMSTDHSEVCHVLAALKDRILECATDFDEQNVCSSLYGLQRMSGKSPELREVLSALLSKFENSKAAFGGHGIGNILFGLRVCKEAPEAQLILDELFRRVTLLEVKTKDFKELNTLELRSLCQRLVLFLDTSEGKPKSYDRRWQELRWDLSRELSSRPFAENERGPSKAEGRLHAAVVKALRHSSMRVSAGNNLMDLFEADIVIQIPVKNLKDEALIVNIEVDGTCHNDERRRVFTDARDAYLRAGGIVVERLEVATMDKMEDRERDDWIMEKIASAVLTHSFAR